MYRTKEELKEAGFKPIEMYDYRWDTTEYNDELLSRTAEGKSIPEEIAVFSSGKKKIVQHSFSIDQYNNYKSIAILYNRITYGNKSMSAKAKKLMYDELDYIMNTDEMDK